MHAKLHSNGAHHAGRTIIMLRCMRLHTNHSQRVCVCACTSQRSGLQVNMLRTNPLRVRKSITFDCIGHAKCIWMCNVQCWQNANEIINFSVFENPVRVNHACLFWICFYRHYISGRYLLLQNFGIVYSYSCPFHCDVGCTVLNANSIAHGTYYFTECTLSDLCMKS